MLQVQTISFQYQLKKPILKDIQFQLEKGEHLCVMGESGCGKSVSYTHLTLPTKRIV